MTPKIIPFEPWHMLAIAGGPEVVSDVAAVNVLGLAEIYLQKGPAYTILAGEDIVWCGGLVLLWPGVAEAWAAPSILVGQYPVTVHRAVTLTLARLKETMQLRRIQCSVVQGYKQSREWVKRLGFCFEGKMKNYGPDGATHHRFAWVK